MLSTLTIENVVLIEKLNLNFSEGLVAITGETGAGKSILLDSLALVLGGKADSGLIRMGENSARVTAAFDVDSKHAIWDKIDADPGETLILSRSLSKEGKSKATLNDRPVTLETLRMIGAALVDIHAQFETHALLEPARHRIILDKALPDQKLVQGTEEKWDAWQDAQTRVAELKNAIEQAARQQEQWQADLELLDKLQPKRGEEETLLEQRSRAQKAGKMTEAYQEALEYLSGSDNAADKALNRVWKILSRLPEDEQLKSVQEQLDQSIVAIRDMTDRIHDLGMSMRDVPNLELVDDRLHELRDAARRFRVTCDNLEALHEEIAANLNSFASNTKALEKAIQEADTARETYMAIAAKLSDARQKYAVSLAKKVNEELAPLKLERATFAIQIEPYDESGWSANGIDKIRFMAAMNTGQELSPLHKTASGGELSRLLLAIKMVLNDGQPVMIFDEIDQGVGGATAASIGARLHRLGTDHQVIVVTHSAQVAASANAHFVVQKASTGKITQVAVTELAGIEARRDEVARMLAGNTVTNEAKAAADKLLEGHA